MSSDGTVVGAMPTPPGVVANFDNPESIAHRAVVVSVLGAAIAIPICLIRMYTKRCILKNLGWDDYNIAVATMLALGFSIYVCYQTTNCLGLHKWDCPAPKFDALMKIAVTVGPVLFNLTTMFTKVSLGLFYLQVSPFQTGLRVVVYTVMCVSIIHGVLNALGFTWLCQPAEKYWTFSITTGKCVNLNQYILATACINAATDLILLVLPIFILYELQLPLRRKIGAALLLMTGSFICILSLIRVGQVAHSTRVVSADGTWVMVTYMIWLLIELWLGIICACMPLVYAFCRTQVLNSREPNQYGASIVLRDLSGEHNIARMPDDSGYYTRRSSTALGNDQLDAERVYARASEEHTVQLAASNKSLLVTVDRSDL
ncbi:hypothetical protein C7974DRAFT_140301 [Boeremia exigua]|uniref:uncharacterized protein n=1 Tax=Boeremia exigua TaxID=749465 RepID=UPI001E8D8B57|nr:uncharacterized protein C7974DRAFT_140301 [Boeremia exigua]KAH6637376.1 hypothetical protein C7974DRAFT_140301 [Boeremia exigua]